MPTELKPVAMAASVFAAVVLTLFSTSSGTCPGAGALKSPIRSVRGGGAMGATGATGCGACRWLNWIGGAGSVFLGMARKFSGTT